MSTILFQSATGVEREGDQYVEKLPLGWLEGPGPPCECTSASHSAGFRFTRGKFPQMNVFIMTEPYTPLKHKPDGRIPAKPLKRTE